MVNLNSNFTIPMKEKTWKPLTVKCKETGDIIKIKNERFNPEIHELIEEAEVVTKSKVEIGGNKGGYKDPALETEFAELKANKGWLKADTKDRYKELKELLGK